MERHTSGCLLCGKALTYSSTSRNAHCAFCSEMQETNTYCVDSHFVCDGCHSLPATDFIEKACLTTDMKDPLELVIQLMKHPSVNMHGPEHHFLVPAVLLAAYDNASADHSSRCEKLKIANARASSILGGFWASMATVVPRWGLESS
jgi:hypothetical protein